MSSNSASCFISTLPPSSPMVNVAGVGVSAMQSSSSAPPVGLPQAAAVVLLDGTGTARTSCSPSGRSTPAMEKAVRTSSISMSLDESALSLIVPNGSRRLSRPQDVEGSSQAGVSHNYHNHHNHNNIINDTTTNECEKVDTSRCPAPPRPPLSSQLDDSAAISLEQSFCFPTAASTPRASGPPQTIMGTAARHEEEEGFVGVEATCGAVPRRHEHSQPSAVTQEFRRHSDHHPLPLPPPPRSSTKTEEAPTLQMPHSSHSTSTATAIKRPLGHSDSEKSSVSTPLPTPPATAAGVPPMVSSDGAFVTPTTSKSTKTTNKMTNGSPAATISSSTATEGLSATRIADKGQATARLAMLCEVPATLSLKDSPDYVAAVRRLVAAGADVCFQAPWMAMPILHTFISRGQVECVVACLESEARAKAMMMMTTTTTTRTNTKGNTNTPHLLPASFDRQTSAVSMSMPMRMGTSPPSDAPPAAPLGHRMVVSPTRVPSGVSFPLESGSFQHEGGVDFTVTEPCGGNTPLMLAVLHPSLAISATMLTILVEYLFRPGCAMRRVDWTQRNGAGDNLFNVAAERGRLSLLMEKLQGDAMRSIREITGWRPLVLHRDPCRWDWDALGLEQRHFTLAHGILDDTVALVRLCREEPVPDAANVETCVEAGANVLCRWPGMTHPVLHTFILRGLVDCVAACLCTSAALDFTRISPPLSNAGASNGWAPYLQPHNHKSNNNSNHSIMGSTPPMLPSSVMHCVCACTDGAAARMILQLLLQRAASGPPPSSPALRTSLHVSSPVVTDTPIHWLEPDFAGRDFLSCAAAHQKLSLLWPLVKHMPFFEALPKPIPLRASVSRMDWAGLSREDQRLFVVSDGARPFSTVGMPHL